MSIEPGVSGTPVGPPWSVDDVADVHAGLYPPELTADLRARIAADPDGAAILAALDSTVDDLSLLPPLVIPAQYALRLDDAIAAEVRARAEGRTTQIVKGGFGALLNPSTAAAPQPGLPTLTATSTRLPSPRSKPRIEPGAPPPRHAPLIPRVLPGAAQYQPPRTPQPERAAGGPPPYAPIDRGQAPQYPSGGPGSGPGRSGGSTGRGPTGGRPGTVSSLDAARAKRRRRVGGGLLAAAAVAAVVIVGVIGLGGGGGNSGGTDVAALPATTISSTTTVLPGGGNPGEIQAFAIEPGKFDEAFDKLNGTREGKLTDLPVFTACLAANKITGTDVLGVSDVTYQGKSAMAIAVAVPADTAHAKVLVVGTGCGPSGPELLAEETVTR